MFKYSCIGCDYHCPITIEEKKGKYEVSKNCCPTGAGFAMSELKKTMKKKSRKGIKE